MNRLNFKTKGQTLFSISLLHTKNLRNSRAKTKAGKKLFNQEIDLARKKAKKFGITIKKSLPRKFKI